jgi:hypothetical protein
LTSSVNIKYYSGIKKNILSVRCLTTRNGIESIVMGRKSKKQMETELRRQAASLMGRKGGPARAAALTPERRKEIAKKAWAARWAKKKAEAVEKPPA